MEIITNQITRNMKLNLANKFMPIAEQLRNEGNSDYEIVKCFNDFIKDESIKFYRRKKQPENLKNIIEKTLQQKADSKIEMVYFDLFIENNIPFKFQYKIGPYKADFLIDDILVFEIDGPNHDKEYDKKRDEYIENLHYAVLRVPAWLAAISHDVVIDEIKSIIKATS